MEDSRYNANSFQHRHTQKVLNQGSCGTEAAWPERAETEAKKLGVRRPKQIKKLLGTGQNMCSYWELVETAVGYANCVFEDRKLRNPYGSLSNEFV